MAGLVAVIYGVAAYSFTLVALLYLIGFVGNLIVPKSIDSGAAGPLIQSAVIDVMLIASFAIQHSVMARQGFKRWWTRIVPPAAERSTYVLATSLVLALLLWQWRPLPALVWTADGSVAQSVLLGVSALGWVVLLVATCLFNHFELFGLQQVYDNWRRRPSSAPAFRTPGLYKHVRHPIYLGFALAFWATPWMSVGHLLFATAMTGYILI